MERPYRLWNPVTKTHLRWRYYAYPKHAHVAALIECRWAKPGTTIEVYSTAGEHGRRLLGQYTRQIGGVSFRGEKNEVEAPAKKKQASVHHLKRRAENIDHETGEIRQVAR